MTLDQAFEQLKTLADDEIRKGSQKAAGDLHQIVRRLRQAQGEAEIAALLMNAPQEGRCLCVTFEGQQARINASTLIPIHDSAALVSVIESKDTVVTAVTVKELSQPLYGALDGDDRVHLIPVVAVGAVRMVLIAPGLEDTSALETLCEVAGLRLEASNPDAKPVEPSKAWDDLPEAEKSLHLRAQQFARVSVARMRVELSGAVREGQQRHDLYSSLREPIDQARDEYRRQFFSGNSKTMIDYLYVELLRSLANNEDRMLGAGFPGRLT